VEVVVGCTRQQGNPGSEVAALEATGQTLLQLVEPGYLVLVLVEVAVVFRVRMVMVVLADLELL
jgi:nucleosome binding factor SPN SPT16 subunit